MGVWGLGFGVWGLLLRLSTNATPAAAHLAVIRDSIGREMDRGLQRAPSKIRMLTSFVDKLPTGAEAGGVLALDLGGTNYRCAGACSVRHGA